MIVRLFLRLLPLAIVLGYVDGSHSDIRRATFGSRGSNSFHRPTVSPSLLSCRGGSIAEAGGDAIDPIEVPDGQTEDQDEDEEGGEETMATPISSQPVKLLIKTNFGNSVIDEKVELMAARTRDVASLKKSLSRLLPGRPPVLSLQLLHEGRLLDDEELVDELFDEEDEEDEDMDEEDDAAIVLILNAIPPVDPKFATELGPQLKSHLDGDDNTMTTEDLIDAYFLNQASISRNAQLLANPNMLITSSFPFDIMEEADELKAQLKSQTDEEVWQASLEPVRKKHNLEERRGERYRSGKGGARTNLKKSIQTNLNINWGETIRNFLLFLFFGYFGGRNTLSRSVMLWGAPLCFLLQARPVKMWSKVLFYMLANPPGVVLSLLPAPQQALLNANDEKSFAILYSTEVDVDGGENGGKLDATLDEEPVDDAEESDALSDDDDDDDEEEDSEGDDETDDDEDDETDDDDDDEEDI